MPQGFAGAGSGPGEGFVNPVQLLSSVIAAPQVWRLSYVDDVPELKAPDGSPLYVYNGYGPDAVTYTYEEGTVVVATMAPEPDAATVPGQPLRVEVTSTFVARDLLEDLSVVARRLEQMREFVPSLGRKPVVRFEWGETAVVGQLASLRIEPETRRMMNGNLVAFRVQFALLRRREPTPEYISPTTPEPSTVHLELGAHETFEWAAWRILRNPDLGIVVRRYNPDAGDEEGGARIAVLPRGHSAHGAPLAPVSAPFAGAYAPELQRHAERLRGGMRRWAALPAELTGEEGPP